MELAKMHQQIFAHCSLTLRVSFMVVFRDLNTHPYEHKSSAIKQKVQMNAK